MPKTNEMRFFLFPRIRRDPVKLTALLYLQEALLRERYEECAEMIEIAREFGAQPFEIRNVLEEPRRKLTA
ncbi:MAG: hypothetical protein ACOY3K_04940 [Candidatus Omnitrophota bacterium]